MNQAKRAAPAYQVFPVCQATKANKVLRAYLVPRDTEANLVTRALQSEANKATEAMMDLEERLATEVNEAGKAIKASKVREAMTCLVTQVRQVYLAH